MYIFSYKQRILKYKNILLKEYTCFYCLLCPSLAFCKYSKMYFFVIMIVVMAGFSLLICFCLYFLNCLFYISLNTGIFPAGLKSSRMVPIFNAGNAELCDNFRPIALLSTLSKILEKIVSVQLVNHLDGIKIIYKH
jgi:hypothetical protein